MTNSDGDDVIDYNYERICDLKVEINTLNKLVTKLLIGRKVKLSKIYTIKHEYLPEEDATVKSVDSYGNIFCNVESGERVISLCDIDEIL